MSIYKDFYEENYGRIKQLEKENERLKKELWQLQHRKMWNEEAALQAELLIKENERLKAEFNNNSLCNKIQIYEADEARMRKALEEIREISQEACSSLATNLCRKRTCEICGRITDAEAIKKILIKISEVLNV